MPGVKGTLEEFQAGKLHSGSKSGPVVKNRKQAIAIGLSEARKAGEHVAPKHHSFASSNEPFGQTRDGEKAAHAIPQGHKTHGGGHMVDGAGRGGHDHELRNATEHKMPTHPAGSHATATHIPESEGVAGHPGTHLELGANGHIVGKSFSAKDTADGTHAPSEPGQGPTAGHPGMHAGMGSKPHGFGHAAHQRSGHLRNSGHTGAHRIGKRG